MLVSSLIAGAMRKIGVLASGQTPSAPEAADALEALRLMYEEMVANGVFGRQADVAVPDGTANFTARENRRYTVEDLANVTITLPTFIEDRWWLWQWPWDWGPVPVPGQEPYSGVRPPMDGNVVRVADLATTGRRLFVYDSAIARWVSLLDLDMNDEAPLSTRYGAGLQAILGVKLSSEYGVEVPPATALEAGRCQSALSHRLDGPAAIVPAVYF